MVIRQQIVRIFTITALTIVGAGIGGCSSSNFWKDPTTPPINQTRVEQGSSLTQDAQTKQPAKKEASKQPQKKDNSLNSTKKKTPNQTKKKDETPQDKTNTKKEHRVCDSWRLDARNYCEFIWDADRGTKRFHANVIPCTNTRMAHRMKQNDNKIMCLTEEEKTMQLLLEAK